MRDFKKTENVMLELLELLSTNLIESEFQEVQDFIDAGEYGLALETVIYIIEEESKVIPREALALSRLAGEYMGMDGDLIVKRMTPYIL